MYPTLTILGRTISTYMLVSVLGGFFAAALACVLVATRGKKFDSMILLSIAVLIGGFLGAHLLYAITHAGELILLFSSLDKLSGISEFFKRLFPLIGGMVYYGSLIGGILAGAIYLKLARLDSSDFSDACAPAIPLFHAFGRVGCFLGGCCYGVPCRVGFVFTHAPFPEANGIVRFPTVLVESGFNFLLCIGLVILFFNMEKRGRLLPLYIIFYGTARFILEFIRGDAIRGALFGISTSQLISILLIAAAIVALILKNRRERGANS